MDGALRAFQLTEIPALLPSHMDIHYTYTHYTHTDQLFPPVEQLEINDRKHENAE